MRLKAMVAFIKDSDNTSFTSRYIAQQFSVSDIKLVSHMFRKLTRAGYFTLNKTPFPPTWNATDRFLSETVDEILACVRRTTPRPYMKKRKETNVQKIVLKIKALTTGRKRKFQKHILPNHFNGKIPLSTINKVISVMRQVGLLDTSNKYSRNSSKCCVTEQFVELSYIEITDIIANYISKSKNGSPKKNVEKPIHASTTSRVGKTHFLCGIQKIELGIKTLQEGLDLVRNCELDLKILEEVRTHLKKLGI
jgi:hypothetical protein